jgi:transcriptional antiterminator RfaH
MKTKPLFTPPAKNCVLLLQLLQQLTLLITMPSLELERWYAVYAKPRREEIARFYIERKGILVFFPKLFIPRPTTKHPQIVPLFPNYLFVRIRTLIEYDSVRWSPGVRNVVSFEGTPTPLDEEVIEFLKSLATPAGIITVRSALTERGIGGMSESFAKLTRLIQGPLDSRERIGVLMQFLHYKTSDT